MTGLCEGGNEPPGSLKANNAFDLKTARDIYVHITQRDERHCDDTPLPDQRQIQMERSLTPVSERVRAVEVESKRNHCELQSARESDFRHGCYDAAVPSRKLPTFVTADRYWYVHPQSSRRAKGEKQPRQDQVHDACCVGKLCFAKAPLREDDK
ncbi:hypothetical protein ANN_21389 [Periplaneta americana]|uniref:Uncharacterized protein n=1 Tax=Periplaneta americana TaxID=6978 RepID=A0ABQ8SG20_PERAM|nr:hypothetical protein ANN_21389 [Periplaneta americana]